MSNMSYCRFRNTYNDMLDCYDHMADNDLDEEEEEARGKLIDLCDKITKHFGG